MNQLQQFIKRGRLYAYMLIVLTNLSVVGTWLISSEVWGLPTPLTLSLLLMVSVVTPMLIVHFISTIFVQPLQFVWQAILYIAPETTSVPAPETHNIKYAKELVINLINHVYQLADVSKHIAHNTDTATEELNNNFIANSLPLPLMVIDKENTVIFANNTMLEYIDAQKDDAMGKDIYSLLDLSFSTDDTFDSWLKQVRKNEVSASQTWERVRLNLSAENSHKTRFFDLAAYYNKANQAGYETMIVCFDHTKMYTQDDQAVNFVALAVHELRTPLTMLRGYIEALEEELRDNIDEELSGFLEKTQAAAGQLATFVSNILNVARVEDDQMILKLQEENWSKVLSSTIDELRLRGQVRGIAITTDVEDGLPAVGVDRISMYEVISNLIDNAIKYSGSSKEIRVSAKLSKEGLVETSIQDFGVGIPQTALPHVFDKFYRDHHNRAQIGGTGLGLYLGKNVIKGHGGSIWVHSKEGHGSTFSFTLVPYAKLAEELKNNDNEDITRSAHGWIKNHSLYRR